MSKGWHWLLAVALIAALAFSPVIGQVASAQQIPAGPLETQEGPPSEGAALGPSEEAAKQAGETWLEKISLLSGELSAWRGATLGSPQAFYGLDGQINSYLFAIEGQGGVAGHVLVGSAAYGYPIFKAGGNPPPPIPTAAEARAGLASLGLAVTQAQVASPARLLHLGPDQLYALYGVGSTSAAVNLGTRKAVLSSGLAPDMPTPEEYLQDQRELFAAMSASSSGVSPQIAGSGYNVLNMRVVCGGQHYCGPCSASSIAAYYRDVKGYSWFPSNPDDLYAAFAKYMGEESAVWGWQYGPDFINTTHDLPLGSYANFSQYTDQNLTPDDYLSVVSDIDNGWPSALLKYLPDEHWVALRGYHFDEQAGYWQIFVTDSFTGYDMLTYDWSYFTGGPNDAKVSIHDR